MCVVPTLAVAGTTIVRRRHAGMRRLRIAPWEAVRGGRDNSVVSRCRHSASRERAAQAAHAAATNATLLQLTRCRRRSDGSLSCV